MPRPDSEESRPSLPSKPQPFALGTGFVIDESGLLLTNHHVIDGAEGVKVQFNEDDEYIPAEVIGRDPELDVALLSVKPKGKLSALPLGDSDRIEVGEYVVAIGNPLGYGHSVTHGILSARERKTPEMRLAKYLQTDASINPGNSGGPLINMKGEVIGINNAIDARAQGIGFAIPINSVKQILNQLKTKGSVSRGYLGIGVGEFSDEIAEQIGVPKGTRGVLVAEVFKGQSAEKAGILPYDVITRVNGDKITNPLDLTTRITAIPVGGIAEITLYRKGKEKTLALKVGERPSPIAGRADWNSNKKSNKTATFNEMKEWGFRAEDLNPELAKSLGIPFSDSKASPSVVVTDLDFGKPAAESGLLRGDVVLDLGGKTIQNVNQLEETLKGTKGKSLLIRVRRYGPQGETTVVILLKPS
jgi:serine protease Do